MEEEMNIEEKLGNVIGWLSAMSFIKPETASDLAPPISELNDILEQLKQTAQ